jgi:hypothetical protein
MSGLYDAYDGLTPAERRFIKEQPPTVSLKLWQSAATAAEEAKKYPGAHNGKGDAFRHAYWSALMTKHCGVESAKKYGFAHESVPPGDGSQCVLVGSGSARTQPRAERVMDEHNNSVGRDIGKANLAVSDDKLATLIHQALRDGMLMVKP